MVSIKELYYDARPTKSQEMYRLCKGRTAHDLTALEGAEGSASRPRRSLPHGKDPVPIVQEAGWAPGPVRTGAENIAPPQRDSIPGPSSP